MVDLDLPDGSGLALLREMKQSPLPPAAVVLTVHDDDENLFGALAAGADGYLLKEQPEDLLQRQLRLWRQGQPPLSPRMAQRILAHFRTVPADAQVVLTPRETDVLGCIGRDLRVAETARHLGIAESTVTTYIKCIYGKLGITTRAEAALEAARRGLA